MSANLTETPSDEIVNAYCAEFDTMADRAGLSDSAASSLRYIAEMIKESTEGLVKWMDKRGIVFAREVDGPPGDE